MPSTRSSSDATTADESGLPDRVGSLARNYGLHLEAVLATGVTILSPIAVFVFFVGVFAAMPMGPPGESGGGSGGVDPLLTVALVLLGIAVLAVLALALAIPVRSALLAYVRTDGFERTDPLDDHPVRTVTYVGLRSVTTLAAVVTLAGGIAGLVAGNPWGGGGSTASTFFVLAGLGGVGMVLGVFVESVWAFLGALVDRGSGHEGDAKPA